MLTKDQEEIILDALYSFWSVNLRNHHDTQLGDYFKTYCENAYHHEQHRFLAILKEVLRIQNGTIH